MKRGVFRSAFVILMVVSVSSHSRAHGQNLPVPATIRAEGVPPVPAAIGEALNQYQSIRSASLSRLELGRARDVCHYPVRRRAAGPPGGAARGARNQLTFLPERVLSVTARPKRDQFLY